MLLKRDLVAFARGNFAINGETVSGERVPISDHGRGDIFCILRVTRSFVEGQDYRFVIVAFPIVEHFICPPLDTLILAYPHDKTTKK